MPNQERRLPEIGQPSIEVFGVSLFSVLGEDAFDLLGNEAAVGLADCWPTRRHDSKRLTLPDHFLFEKSYNCIDIPIPSSETAISTCEENGLSN